MRVSRTLALAIVGLQLGCGSTPTSPPPPPPPPPPPAVSGVTVAPATATLTAVGAQAALQATLSPNGATGTVTWRSDDPGIATVAGSGTGATVTAVARGTTRVVAAVGSIEGSAAITVAVPSVTAIVVTPALDTVLQGATRQFAAAVTADNGVDPSVTWTTGTPAVATVNAAGLATAVTPGTTTVVATSVSTPATSGTASLVVRAPVVSNVAVTPSAATLFAAETLQLTAIVTADPGVSTTVTWSSSNESAATVSPTGLVTAVAPGPTTVSAASTADPSRTAFAAITVGTPTPLTSWTPLSLGSWDRSHWGLIDGIHSLSNGEAFAESWPGAVGSQTIARREGGVWSAQTLLPFDRLNAVGGAGDELWVGNSTGRLARWDGTAFVEVPSPIVGLGPIVAFGGAGPGNVIAAVNSSASRVLLYQGGSWTTLPAVAPVLLTSIAGKSPTEILATLSGSQLLGRWNGTLWTFTPNAGFNLTASGFDNGGAPVVAGVSLGSARWTGAAWQPLAVPPSRPGGDTEHFRNMVRCNGELYSATQARVFRLDGDAWTTIADYGEGPLGSSSMIVGCGGDEVLRVGGSDGSIARWTGTGWVQEAFEPQINGIAVVSSQRAWAVGASGVVFRWDGSTWAIDHADFTAFRFFSVTALPGDFVMVAAASGPRGIWRRQGGSWTLDPTPNDAVSVWAASPTLAFAAAAGGLLRWDGTSWSSIAAPAGTFFNRVAGVSETFVVASGNAGINGRLAKWDGTSWTAMPMPAVGLMQDVAVASPTAAFAVGQGFVLRWNGTTWINLPLPGFMTSGGDLYRVAALSATEAYVTNLAGTVFRFDGVNWSQTTQLGLSDVPASRFTANAIAVVPGFGLIGTTGGGIFQGHPGVFLAPRAR